MDEIESLVAEIKKEKSFLKTNFSDNFLHNVGEVFERHGLSSTIVFLNTKQDREATRYQARALIDILKKFEHCPKLIQTRSLGRLIIVSLNDRVVAK